MKQADCLRMALAELPQGTMEIVGRPAAEPGVLFTGTFQGETDGRGRMEVYPVFPGVEASFNTVLGTYAAFRHEAARSTLEINHCRLGRVGWDLRDGMSVYLGEGDLSLHSADCCADSVMHFPAEMYAGLMICVDLTHLAESPPPLLAEADFQAERLAEKFCGGGTFALPAGPELEEIFRPLYRQPEMRRLPYLRLKLQELLLYLEGLESGGRELTRYGSQQTARIQEIHALLTEQVSAEHLHLEGGVQGGVRPAHRHLYERVPGAQGHGAAAGERREHRRHRGRRGLREPGEIHPGIQGCDGTAPHGVPAGAPGLTPE